MRLYPITTSANTSQPFTVNTERLTFIASGTYAGSEKAGLEIYDGTAWVDVYISGTEQKLDVDTTVLTVYGRGRYRFVKSSTAAAAGVALAD